MSSDVVERFLAALDPTTREALGRQERGGAGAARRCVGEGTRTGHRPRHPGRAVATGCRAGGCPSGGGTTHGVGRSAREQIPQGPPRRSSGVEAAVGTVLAAGLVEPVIPTARHPRESRRHRRCVGQARVADGHASRARSGSVCGARPGHRPRPSTKAPAGPVVTRPGPVMHPTRPRALPCVLRAREAITAATWSSDAAPWSTVHTGPHAAQPSPLRRWRPSPDSPSHEPGRVRVPCLPSTRRRPERPVFDRGRERLRPRAGEVDM